VIPARDIISGQQMSQCRELLGPSQVFQQAVQADDATDKSDFSQRRGVGPQLRQPTEDMRISAQLFQVSNLWEVSAQVVQKAAYGCEIVSKRCIAERRGQRFD
jgi:hypothetical protein